MDEIDEALEALEGTQTELILQFMADIMDRLDAQEKFMLEMLNRQLHVA